MDGIDELLNLNNKKMNRFSLASRSLISQLKFSSSGLLKSNTCCFRSFSSSLNGLGGASNVLNNQRTKPAQTAAEAQKAQAEALNNASTASSSDDDIAAKIKTNKEFLQHLAEKKAFTTQDVNQLESLLEKYVKQGSQQDSAVKGPIHFVNAAIIICLIIVVIVRQRDSMYYEMVKELLLDTEDQLVQAKKEINELKKRLPAEEQKIIQKPVVVEEETEPVKKRSNII